MILMLQKKNWYKFNHCLWQMQGKSLQLYHTVQVIKAACKKPVVG